jgi:seryl-tRNA synthetase
MKLNCVICFAKKAGEDTSEMIKNTEDNKKSAAEKEAEVREVLKQLNAKLEIIGNLVHDSVPVSDDEVNDLACFISFHSANAYLEF